MKILAFIKDNELLTVNVLKVVKVRLTKYIVRMYK